MNISSIPLFYLKDQIKIDYSRNLFKQQKVVVLIAMLILSLLISIVYPNTLAATNKPIQSSYTIQKKLQNKEIIYFYNKGERYYELTNFYENWRKDGLHYIVYENQCWKTSEHAFQAEKFNWAHSKAQDIRKQIIQASDAKAAFQIAQKNISFVRPNWQNMKDDIMLKILRAKFKDPHLSNVLHKTGHCKLVEASPVDSYWGYGADKKGQNRLGLLLMQVRKERFGF